jgi:hypothetical protein
LSGCYNKNHIFLIEGWVEGGWRVKLAYLQ